MAPTRLPYPPFVPAPTLLFRKGSNVLLPLYDLEASNVGVDDAVLGRTLSAMVACWLLLAYGRPPFGGDGHTTVAELGDKVLLLADCGG